MSTTGSLPNSHPLVGTTDDLGGESRKQKTVKASEYQTRWNLTLKTLNDIRRYSTNRKCRNLRIKCSSNKPQYTKQVHVQHIEGNRRSTRSGKALITSLN